MLYIRDAENLDSPNVGIGDLGRSNTINDLERCVLLPIGACSYMSILEVVALWLASDMTPG
jgi:hypothetical protein